MNKKIKTEAPTTEHKKSSSVKKETHRDTTNSTPEKTNDTTALVSLEQQNTDITLPPSKTASKKITKQPTTETPSLNETSSEPNVITEEITPPIEPVKDTISDNIDKQSSTENQPESTTETTETILNETTSKEKLIDRQLEILWANGRKELLNQQPYHTKMPLHQENIVSTENNHKPIKQ